MNKMIIASCLILVLAGRLNATEILVPAGTKLEGVIINGIYAVSDNPNPFFAIRASKNPVAVGNNEIPIKDCLVMGDVIADLTIKRAFFKATKIICSNLKEPNGVRIRGYAVDSEDNKLGITGIPDSPPPVAASGATAVEVAPRFLEVEPGKKVFLLITEGVSITIK